MKITRFGRWFCLLSTLIMSWESYAAQAQFFPLQQNLLRVDPSGADRYWLTIPNKGIVLIQVRNPGQNPQITKDATAKNFEYVQDKTFAKLPRGLFSWANDLPYVVRPTPQGLLYTGNKNKSGSFIQVKSDGKTLERVQGNPVEWDPTGKAPNPFDIKELALILEIPKSQTGTAGSTMSGAAINGFSYVTCNMLDHHFYTMVINDPRNKRDQKLAISLAQRQQLFNAAFADPQQFKNKDILAFQEYSARGTSLAFPSLPNYQMITNDEKTLCTLFNTEKFIYVWHLSGIFNVPKTSASKGFLILVLLTKGAEPKLILNFNIHIIGGPLSDEAKKAGYTYETFREAQIKELLKQLEQNSKQAQAKVKAIITQLPPLEHLGIVVSGDFNSDARGNLPLYKLIANQFGPDLIDVESRMGNQRPPTEYPDRALDYIFYSHGTLKLDSLVYFPPNPKELLTHAIENDAQKKYFSDHSQMQAQFSFKKAGALTTPSEKEKKINTAGGAKIPDPAWAASDANLRALWERLQPIMELHNDIAAPQNKTIWDLWNKPEWDEREEIIGKEDENGVWVNGLVLAIDPQFGEFLNQYLIDYDATQDRPTFVSSVGAVIPSLYGTGKIRPKNEIDLNIDVIAATAPGTGKMLREKFNQRFGKK